MLHFCNFSVDGAIHKAAGHFLLSECKSFKNGCPTGDALLTGGYKLPAKCKSQYLTVNHII